MTGQGQASQPSLVATLAWMGEGTTLFADQVAGLDDAALAGPSRLPGWTRAHVAGHVARNADALGNLLHWARTGEERPMYPSTEARNRGIEESAAQPPDRLRADVREAGDRLLAAARDLPEAAWSAKVRTARGREVPVSAVPWMRVREVWVHAVDLDASVGFTAFQPDLVDAFLDDAVTFVGAKPDCPAVLVAPDDRDQTWTLGGEDAANQVRATGAATGLLAWLTGRAGPEESGVRTANGAPPALPAWL